MPREDRDAQAAAQEAWAASSIFQREQRARFDAAFANIVQQRVDALLVDSRPFFLVRRDQVVALAAASRIPQSTLTRVRRVGGLISYGTASPMPIVKPASMPARILKGAKPAELPVLQPTKFELVINLKTAKTLGLDIPPTLLGRADEVIE